MRGKSWLFGEEEGHILWITTMIPAPGEGARLCRPDEQPGPAVPEELPAPASPEEKPGTGAVPGPEEQPRAAAGPGPSPLDSKPNERRIEHSDGLNP